VEAWIAFHNVSRMFKVV